MDTTKTSALALALLLSTAPSAARAATLLFDSGLYSAVAILPVGSGGVPATPYTTSMRATGTFHVQEDIVAGMVDQPLTLAGFTLSDGLGTLDSAVRSTKTSFRISTDATGSIVGWRFVVSSRVSHVEPGGLNWKMFSSAAGTADDGFSATDALCDSTHPGNTSCYFIDLPSHLQEARAAGAGTQSLTLAVVPLPPGGMLLLTGLAGLGYASRRGR
jgi:hypothetical protein